MKMSETTSASVLDACGDDEKEEESSTTESTLFTQLSESDEEYKLYPGIDDLYRYIFGCNFEEIYMI